MLLKIVCLLMRWLFNLAILVIRGDRVKNAELLVLRHENAVLRRNAGRVRYNPVGAENLSPYATWEYSWIRPPSRSRRRTRTFAPDAGGCGRPAGGLCCSARCGRCEL